MLLVRLALRFDAATVEELQSTGQLIVERVGRVDSVIDFSQVEEVAIPVEVLANRGTHRPLMGDQLRVYVMPRDDIEALGRMFASHQPHRQPRAVGGALHRRGLRHHGLFAPKFEPVAI